MRVPYKISFVRILSGPHVQDESVFSVGGHRGGPALWLGEDISATGTLRI